MISRGQEGDVCCTHEEIYDSVIIGAGMAGLAAGRLLRESGKNFVILEADIHVGGRAITDSETLDIPFDHGAAWIHSAPNNPLMK